MILSLEQAKEALKEGKKVRHVYFLQGEWIRQIGNRIHTEDGFSVEVQVFFEDRLGKGWEDGWIIDEEPYINPLDHEQMK